MSFPPPAPTFVGPAKFHGARTNFPVKRIVIHCTVSPCVEGAALGVARYFRDTVVRPSSAHYVVDPGKAYQCVGDSWVAYHAPPNEDSIGVELCDALVSPTWDKKHAARWHDVNHNRMLFRAARLVARLCLAYDVPARRLTTAQVRNGEHGICGHVNVSQAFGQSAHWDPGAEFPWGHFMDLVEARIKKLRAAANPPKFLNLHAAHLSMQFSDTAKQKQRDVKRLFDRAEARGYDWITGTEAGEEPLTSLLRDEAATRGFTFHQFKSNWVAVRQSLSVDGKFTNGQETVVDNDLVVGPGHDLNLVWTTFTHADLGRISVIGSHLATKGRPDAKDPLYRRNLAPNETLTEAIGNKARELGKGSALVFYGGDQNIVDRDADTFLGAPLTSAWDEVGRWENTGHGNIDVIASYDDDGRVAATWIDAFPDDEVPLATDHFLVEAQFRVEQLV